MINSCTGMAGVRVQMSGMRLSDNSEGYKYASGAVVGKSGAMGMPRPEHAESCG